VIVLAHGRLASCVALTSFIESSEQFIAKVREDVNADRDPNWFTALIGTPAMRSIGSVVFIPSFHPGLIAYAGPLAPYLIEAFFLVHRIACFAIDVAMNCNKSLPRNAVCEKVKREVQRILEPSHEFGKKFSQSLEKLKIIQQAFFEEKNFRSLQRMRNRSRSIQVAHAQENLVNTTAYKTGRKRRREDED
jgi:hypothetical protein